MTEDAQPDRRSYTHYTELKEELSQQLDDHATRLDNRLEFFLKRALMAFGIIGLTSVGSLVGFGIVLSKQGQTASEIQAQRRDSIYRSCFAQNLRHDNTITQLQIISEANTKKHPDRATQIKESIKPTITLIDALVPKEDCVRLVQKSVKGG